jgi:uncharacterized protein (DUF342 family)
MIKEEQLMEQSVSEVFNVDDGRISITILDNAMEVWGDFTPALGSGRPLTIKQTEAFLKSNGVIAGINWDTINKALADCAQTRQALMRILIACGEPPVANVPAYFEMRPEFDPSKKNGIMEDEKARIDYREFSPFTIVEKDKRLAVLCPEIQGKKGFTVYGAELPFEIMPHETIEAGKNIRVEKHALYAASCGQLLLSNGILNVEESLEIKGSVGYATGHIKFPGDIIIYGFVNDGFKIYSGASITCMQTLDVTNVFAKGKLDVSGGIIGRMEALITIKAESHVRFIEHCHFSSEGDIEVGEEILDSTIFTRGKLVMKSDSSIIASSVHSIHSVFADNIENRAGRTSSFHLGIDFTLQESVTEGKKQIEELGKKLAKAEARVAAMPMNRREYFEKVRLHIEERLNDETRAFNKLLAQFYIDEKAILQVTGEVAAGTCVEIGGASYTVLSSIRNVCFKLSENKKHIIIDRYDDDAKPVERLKLLHGRRRKN